jgi:hypothetical protein
MPTLRGVSCKFRNCCIITGLVKYIQTVVIGYIIVAYMLYQYKMMRVHAAIKMGPLQVVKFSHVHSDHASCS